MAKPAHIIGDLMKNKNVNFPKCIICKQSVDFDFENEIPYEGVKEILIVLN